MTITLVTLMTTSTTTPKTTKKATEKEDFPTVADPFASMPSLDDVLDAPIPNERKEPEATEATEATEEKKSEYDPYTLQDLLAIYDDIIFENSFSKEYRLRSVRFTLKTRSSATVIKVNQALDNLKAQSVNTYQTYSNYLMLAASLKSYNNQDFSEDNLKEAYDYLLTLNTAAIDLMLDKLNEFDQMIGLALKAGKENF